jgi:hypothetical protein
MKLLKQLWDLVTSKSAAFVLAAVGIGVGVYGIWFYRASAAISFEVVSDTKVLDIHESIGKLDVIYDGQSLKATNKELRVLQITLANRGRADITKDAFDSSDPLGFEIPRGAILEPPLITGSTKYLSKHVSISEPNSGTVLISPIIFEAGEWIHLKLLVAVNAGDSATIQPIGKIAGVKSITVNDLSRDINSLSLWSRIIHSDDWLPRFILSLPLILVSILSIVVFAAIVVGVSSMFIVPVGKLRDVPVRKHRKKMIETYQKTYALQPSDHFVTDEYYKRGRAVISGLRSYFSHIEEVNVEAQTIAAMQASLSAHFDRKVIDLNVHFRTPGERNHVFGNSRHVADDLMESRIREAVSISSPTRALSAELSARGLQSEKDGITTIAPDLGTAVSRFETFLLSYNQGPLDDASTQKERMLE